MSDKAHQTQMFDMALQPKDIVFTPEYMAKEIVDLFKPKGKILEPCIGDGAFIKFLPKNSDWCEIEKGRDFFLWDKSYDWIIGNPPYSMFNKWLRHSFTLALNIVYLIPINKIFNDNTMLRDIYTYGGIPKIYVIGRGEKANFPMGYPVGAVHFQKSYKDSAIGKLIFRDPLVPIGE